jgi:hypothetical protein
MQPDSVNGTAVLARMFETAGHRVTSRDRMTPRLRDGADCIVWFPDDFEPPDQEHRDWLQQWLKMKPGRTLIYVGRDFDAAPWYWRHVQEGAPFEQAPLIGRQQTEAEADFRAERGQIPASEDCGWFTVEGKYQPRKVRTLQGDDEWLEGVDPAKLEIELNGRVLPHHRADVLLRSEDDLLISSRRVRESRLIVVANGSFLLNLPLVNHEHRKLAGKLIDAIGPPQQRVVFLESYAGGPPIFEHDPANLMPSPMAIFNLWPTNWILLHLAAIGIMFCFARAAIFGRPRDVEPDGASDFGRHIAALGELLQRSQDEEYALARIQHYRQMTKSE